MNRYYYYALLKRIIKFPLNFIFHIKSVNTPKNNILKKFDSVFVIGLAKTGTSSVRDFLKMYGLKHMTINRFSIVQYKKKNYSYFDKIIQSFDSFDDKPFNRIDLISYLMTSQRNIGFIYTKRDPHLLFESKVKYAKKLGKFNIPERSEKKAEMDASNKHFEICKRLAKKFKKEMLIIDVTKESDVANKISHFLKLEDKNLKFPHANKT